MVRLYLRILENFVRLIFQNGFRVLHIPLVRMVKFKLLAQFSLDHLAHPLMSSLIISLCKFTAVAYYVIDRFVFIAAYSTFTIFFHPVYSRFDIVLITFFCAAIRRDSFSLLRFPFLCHVQVFSCAILLVCLLKYPYSCFSSHFYLLIFFALLMLVLSVLFLVTVICLLRVSLYHLVLILMRRCYLECWQIIFLFS